MTCPPTESQKFVTAIAMEIINSVVVTNSTGACMWARVLADVVNIS